MHAETAPPIQHHNRGSRFQRGLEVHLIRISENHIDNRAKNRRLQNFCLRKNALACIGKKADGGRFSRSVGDDDFRDSYQYVFPSSMVWGDVSGFA